MIEERKENQVKHMPYVCEFSNIPVLPWMASNEQLGLLSSLLTYHGRQVGQLLGSNFFYIPQTYTLFQIIWHLRVQMLIGSHES